jgi:hypothetical protein
VIEGTVAAVFLQEIDEVFYAAFLPKDEIMTVLEFETPPYSKTYGGDWHPLYSQRYKRVSCFVKSQFMTLTSATSFDNLMPMIVIAGGSLLAVIFAQEAHCKYPCIPKKENETHPMCRVEDFSMGTTPVPTSSGNATINATMAKLLVNATVDLLNATLANTVSNFTTSNLTANTTNTST